MNKLEKDILNNELRLDDGAFVGRSEDEPLSEQASEPEIEELDLEETFDGEPVGEDIPGPDTLAVQLKIDDALLQPIDKSDRLDEEEDILDLSSFDEDASEIADGVAAMKDISRLYEDTIDMMEEGELDIDSAIALLKKSAEDGHALSYISLGQLYCDSNGLIYNPALAFDFYSKAAELECGAGYYNLGLCYSRGFGCEKDEVKAAECFKSGAAIYDPDCICALGICYEFGIGEEINYEYAVTLYQKGYELGHAAAANNLGGCFFYGHGVEQDKDRAIRIYLDATSLGSSDAECRLGICCETGDGCQKDIARAFEYYHSASKKKNAAALYHLARCYDNGLGAEQNFNRAYKYYARSASLGYNPARYEAGRMCISGRGTKKNYDLAYRYFSAAARAGYAPAEYSVANCFFEGTGTLRNFTNAYMNYLNVYESHGDDCADAAFRIGLCHLKGLGTDRDEEAAFEWFLSGARLGSPNAMYMLGECYFFGIGTAANEESAANSFIKAAETVESSDIDIESYTPLFLALAYCFEEGVGVEKDHTRARAIYKKTAQSGVPEALYRLGQAIMHGVGMKAEYAAARPHILRAARAGYIPAMLTMGIMSDEGKGVRSSKSDAESWYSRAASAAVDTEGALFDFPERTAERLKLCNESKIVAEYRLGMLMTRHNVSAQNYISAFEHIAITASAGYEPAQTEIAKIHISGGDLKEYYESPFSSPDACFADGNAVPDKQTLAEALGKLGDTFFDGKNLLKKNESAAARCYRYSAELGNIDACYSYGWCLRHGVGVHENDAESVKWLKMAADRGNSNAAYSYGLCCEEGCGTGVRNMHDALYYYRLAASSGNEDAAQRYRLLSAGE